MKRYLTPFVLTIVAAAAATAPFVPVAGLLEHLPLVAYFTALALLAGYARIRIPGLGTHMSAVDPIVFCALALAGPLAACTAGLAAAVGNAVRSRANTTPIQVAFNLGNVFLSFGVAGIVFTAAGGEPGNGIANVLLPLALGTAAYFVVNSILTTTVLVLAGKPGGFVANWTRTFLWAIPAYAGGAVLGLGLYAVSVAAHAAWAVGLGVAACWLLARVFEAQALKSTLAS